MSIFASLSKLFGSPKKVQTQKPRAHRYRPQGFATPFGQVKDLSASGMQIYAFRKPPLEVGQCVSMRLSTAFQQVVVNARVAWVRKIEDGYAAGFQFVDLLPPVKAAVEALAKHGFAETGAGPGPRRGVHTHTGAAEEQQAKVGGKSIMEQRLHYEDLYAMFGVAPDASPEDIQHAYRKLAQQLHPDRNDAEDAAEQFSRVTKAYSILKDPDKRKRYDEMRAVQKDLAAKNDAPKADPASGRDAA